MPRIFTVFIGALLMAAALTSPALAADSANLTKLPNGMSVLVQQDKRFPLVSLRLYVRAGSAYETDEQSGISHLLEHMVFKGTERRAPGEVAETVESAGGYINAATSFDYTVYTIDMPAERWKLGLDVLEDMVFHAKLDPKELESEKKVVLAELERGEDSPGNRRFKTLQPLVWGKLAYRRPIIGYRDTVKSFSREDILNYIATYYQPQSMLAVVVGDVDPAEALAEVQKVFGSLTNNVQVEPKRPLPLPSFDAPRITVEQGPWNKVYLSVGFPIPGLHSAQVPGLDLLGHLLGGDDTSRLYRKFKYEQGLVDSVSAYSMTLDQVGILNINATLDADKLSAFWGALNKELATLDASTFTKQELDRARLNIEDSLYTSKETLGGLASKIGYFQLFENGLEAEENYLYALGGVDTAQLQALADEYLTPKAMASVVLMPENGVEASDLQQSLAGAMDVAWKGAKAEKTAKTENAGQRGQTHTVDLGDGRTLVLLPDKTLPYTSVHVVFGGGDSLLFPDEQGLADLTARSLTKGTDRLSAVQYEDYLSDRAAGISASAGRDLFVVGAKYPTRFAGDLLPLFLETLSAPAFAQAEVDRAKVELTSAIHQREDQPTGLAFRKLFPMLYKDTGYSYLHMGTPEGVAKYGVAEIKSFWERQRVQPWVMAVCGDFDEAAVTEMARTLSKQNSAQTHRFATPLWAEQKNLDLKLEDRNQAHIVVSFPVAGSRSEDTPGLDVLRQALAGQGGMLFREMRDKQGLGYTVTAFLWQAPQTGFLAFYIGTYPDKMDQALEGFRKAVTQLHGDLLSDEEVSRSQSLIRGDYFRDHQSLGSRSREAAGLLIRGFDLDHNRANLDEVDKVTASDLRELARKYLIWDKGYVLTVAP